jgi:hypothetical protein
VPEGCRGKKQPPDHQRGRGHLAVAPLGTPSPGLSLGGLRARRARLRFTRGGEAIAESKNKQGQVSGNRESVIQARTSGRNSSEGLPFFGLDNGVHCKGFDLAEQLDLFTALRRHETRILRLQPPEAWPRVGVHSETCLVTLRQQVFQAVRHVRHHLPFIADKRAVMRA